MLEPARITMAGNRLFIDFDRLMLSDQRADIVDEGGTFIGALRLTVQSVGTTEGVKECAYLLISTGGLWSNERRVEFRFSGVQYVNWLMSIRLQPMGVVEIADDSSVTVNARDIYQSCGVAELRRDGLLAGLVRVTENAPVMAELYGKWRINFQYIPDVTEQNAPNPLRRQQGSPLPKLWEKITARGRLIRQPGSRMNYMIFRPGVYLKFKNNNLMWLPGEPEGAAHCEVSGTVNVVHLHPNRTSYIELVDVKIKPLDEPAPEGS